jgi:hypothetical protein
MLKSLLLWAMASCILTSLCATIQSSALSFLCLVFQLGVVGYFAWWIYASEESEIDGIAR